jgi:type VI secretion system protein ImpL
MTEIADRAGVAVRSGVQGQLDQRYQQEVLGPCTTIVNNKYPFSKTSSVDVSPEDFGSLFGHGGAFDQFFNQHLKDLVQTLTRPWTWRVDASGKPIGGSPAMLSRFEAAQRIRDMYFAPGSRMPQIRFSVTPLTMDQGSKRFVLDIDGQMFSYQFGPERTQAAVWPGMGAGTASATWDEGAARPNLTYQNQWAWQRLVDAAEMKEETDRRYVLTWRRGTHFATVRIDATTVNNPFNKSAIQLFRCE